MEYMVPTMYIFNNHLSLALQLAFCQAFKVTEEVVYEDPIEAAGVNVHETVVSVYGDTKPFHTGIFLMLIPYLKSVLQTHLIFIPCKPLFHRKFKPIPRKLASEAASTALPGHYSRDTVTDRLPHTLFPQEFLPCSLQ